MDPQLFANDLHPTSSGIDQHSSESISKRLLSQIFDRPQGSGSTVASPPTDPLSRLVPQFTLPAAGSLARESQTTTSPDVAQYALAATSGEPTLPAPIQAAIAANQTGTDLAPIQLQQAIDSLRRLAERSMSDRIAGFNSSQSVQKDSIGSSPGASNPLDANRPKSSPSLHVGSRPLELSSVRSDFPALHQSIHGHPLVWLDNAATTHKPRQVIEAVSNFYALDYSNIHRAAHTLAARATDLYEGARETVQQFIHARSADDIVFVRGTTEGINFVANTIKGFLREGDEILLSEFEHHANIVPWQLIAREVRARIRVIPFDDSGEVLMEEYRRLLGPRTRLVSLTHASNTLGTVLPIEEMTAIAHHHGARVLIDGAQSIAHLPIDVNAIGCDFFVFSGHKVFAPTGIGVVYMHPDLQELLPPWQGGGNMIRRVTFDETTYADAPAKFEAGTPSIGDAVGLGAALNYLRQFDPVSVEAHEHALLDHATRELKAIRGVTIYGTAAHKVGVVSFTLDGYTTEMVGRELDRVGIAVRTGHHCAQPSLKHFGLESTVRPSFAIYNTHEEVDHLVENILRLSRKR